MSSRTCRKWNACRGNECIKMVIPKELHLDRRQKAKFVRWLKFVNQVVTQDKNLLKIFTCAFEEDCVPSSDVKFELRHTGLGTNIAAYLAVVSPTRRSVFRFRDGKQWWKIDLSIDDYGDLTPDEWMT